MWKTKTKSISLLIFQMYQFVLVVIGNHSQAKYDITTNPKILKKIWGIKEDGGTAGPLLQQFRLGGTEQSFVGLILLNFVVCLCVLHW